MGYYNANYATREEDPNSPYCVKWFGESVTTVNLLGGVAGGTPNDCATYKYTRMKRDAEVTGPHPREYCNQYCDKDDSYSVLRLKFQTSSGQDRTCTLVQGEPLDILDWKCLQDFCENSKPNPSSKCPTGEISFTNRTDRWQCFSNKEAADTFVNFWKSTYTTQGQKELSFDNVFNQKEWEMMLSAIWRCICAAISSRTEEALFLYLNFLDFETTIQGCLMEADAYCARQIQQGLYRPDELELCRQNSIHFCIYEKFREICNLYSCCIE